MMLIAVHILGIPDMSCNEPLQHKLLIPGQKKFQVNRYLLFCLWSQIFVYPAVVVTVDCHQLAGTMSG